VCLAIDPKNAVRGTAIGRKSWLQHAAHVTSGDFLDWYAVEWKRVYRTVKNMRRRIFRVSRGNDLHKVRSLQHPMLRSRANVWGSVRRVTQVNHGKSMPGTDQVVAATPEERGALCTQLIHLDLHTVHPLGRVYIPSAPASGCWAFPPSSIDVSKPG
jgi:hypothetical protein